MEDTLYYRLKHRNVAKFPELLLAELSDENSEVISSFRERVKTFVNNRNWISHHFWLYPTICAQYGWRCVSNGLLQCETCYSNLFPVILNNIPLHRPYMKTTFEKLKTAHLKHCPWLYSFCPDSYVRMYPMHKDEAFQTFLKRLKPLYFLGEQLPQIKEGTVEKIGLSTDLCSDLIKISFVMENDYSMSALLLSITGWSKDSESKSVQSLVCQSCQRKVPLFLYIALSSSSDCQNAQLKALSVNKNNSKSCSINGNNVGSAEHNTSIPVNSNVKKESNEMSSPGLKEKKTSALTIGPFDPLYEHRSWCPWMIDSAENSQNTCSVTDDSTLNNIENIPGWQLFVKCLLRNVKHSNASRNVERESLKLKLKRARDMLASWSQ